MQLILVLASLLPSFVAKPTVHQRDGISPVQARGALCGNNGYDKNNPNSFYVSQNPGDLTSIGCSSLCRRAQGCASFAHGGGYCLLYTAPVLDNFLPDPSSPYSFNDLACFGSSDTSAAPSSPSVVNVGPFSTVSGSLQTCDATTVTVLGAQLLGPATTVTLPGTTVTQTLSAVQVTNTITETPSAITKLTTITLSGSVSTLTLPSGTVTQTLPAVTATSTLTLPAITIPATLTLPALTSTITLPAVTSTITISSTITNSATVTIRCVALGVLCTTVT